MYIQGIRLNNHPLKAGELERLATERHDKAQTALLFWINILHFDMGFRVKNVNPMFYSEKQHDRGCRYSLKTQVQIQLNPKKAQAFTSAGNV